MGLAPFDQADHLIGGDDRILPKGRQPIGAPRRLGNIVEADDGQVLGHREAPLPSRIVNEAEGRRSLTQKTA